MIGLFLVAQSGNPMLMQSALESMAHQQQNAEVEARYRFEVQRENIKEKRSTALAQQEMALRQLNTDEERVAQQEAFKQHKIEFQAKLDYEAQNLALKQSALDLAAEKAKGDPDLQKLQRLEKIMEIQVQQAKLAEAQGKGAGGQPLVKSAPVPSEVNVADIFTDPRGQALQKAQKSGKITGEEYSNQYLALKESIVKERYQAAAAGQKAIGQGTENQARKPYSNGAFLAPLLDGLSPATQEQFRRLGFAIPDPESGDPGDPGAAADSAAAIAAEDPEAINQEIVARAQDSIDKGYGFTSLEGAIDFWVDVYHQKKTENDLPARNAPKVGGITASSLAEYKYSRAAGVGAPGTAQLNVKLAPKTKRR